MRSCLIICLVLLLVFVLLVGGLVFAVRPPFRVITAQSNDDVQLEAAMTRYMESRLEVALDDYSGQGDLVITLDQAGLSQILANALSELPIPGNVRPTGIFMNIGKNQIELGGAFKFLFIPVGISGRFGVEMQDENIELKLISSHIGRLPLPINFVANAAVKYANLPDDLAALSVSIPLDFQGGDFAAVKLTGLALERGQINISVFLEEGLVPDIPDEVMDSFDKAYPEIEKTLKNNPAATAALQEIKKLMDSSNEGKKVNPLTLKRLGDELYSTLNQQEIKELEAILESDLITFLQKAQ